MKKVFLFSLFSLFSLVIYAESTGSQSKILGQNADLKSVVEIKNESTVLQYCSSASITRNEVTITCSACRDTQLAADIAVADCIMDLLASLPPCC